MRAIVFLLFVILVFFIIRFTLNRIIQIRQKNRDLAEKTAENSEGETVESMVRCAQCGVHLPQSDAYYDGTDTFCSEGHMQIFHDEKSNHHTDL